MAAYWLPFDPHYIEAVQLACGKILLIGRERQTASALLLHWWNKWEALLLLEWSYQTFCSGKKVGKCKIRYASTKGKREGTASGKLKAQRMTQGKKKKTPLIGMDIWSCIFQESRSIGHYFFTWHHVSYPSKKKQASKSWLVNKAIVFITTAVLSQILELPLLERHVDCKHGDHKVLPS